MASTIEGRLMDAMMAHLTALPGAPPVAYGNILFPAGGVKPDTYVVSSWSPGQPLRVAIDDHEEHVHRGVLGVSVLTPLGSGELQGQELGGRIADHFQAAVITDDDGLRVRITQRPTVSGGYVDGDRWRTPVAVMFETVSV